MFTTGIPCKLIEKRGKQSEIEIEEQRLVINSHYLPDSVKPGETFQLCFLSDKEGKIKEANLAKLILEEILNGK